MRYRFLIDECLWPGLVKVARAAGHLETTCVRDRGLSGMKDHRLIRFAIDGDYTIVTHNAVDFRGPDTSLPGGLYSREAIHAGLVCLSSAFTMSPDRQTELFGYALQEVATLEDLVNQALEVVEDECGEVTILRYGIPDPVEVDDSPKRSDCPMQL
ncbi:hypothetical protein C9I57_25320 [Trinickia symbiotica]|uniref:DUF5615 domain-containing protein n=1 Tax=Trinickia symbiotica TaxID=863227 RepID=A0A2T3XMU9_9BURK|nr:DUF5615 family PIN-like protein [Trinickia symbiotica]PTB17852.1 hypothetical protein C9I57_25320 [Trinickia symbiotica]